MRVEEKAFSQQRHYTLPEDERAMMSNEEGGCARELTLPEFVKISFKFRGTLHASTNYLW